MHSGVSDDVCRHTQECLLPLQRTMLNVQMYRANYTAFGYLMIDRFVKLESCNKFVLMSFCSRMLCRYTHVIVLVHGMW